MKSYITALLTITISFLAFSCSKPQTPTFIDIDHLRISKVSKQESVVSADLRCFNPNNYKLGLKSSSLDFYVNDRLLGKSVSDSLITIPALDTFYVPVTLRVDMSNILQNALQSVLSSEVNVRVEGNAKAGRSGFYVNLPVHYEGKQKLNLFN